MSATRKFQVIGFPKPKVQVIAKRAENKALHFNILLIKELTWTKKENFEGSEGENFETCERAKRVRKFEGCEQVSEKFFKC